MCAEWGAAKQAWMACADGVRLASRIWSPEGQGPWPVLLMRQPYGSRPGLHPHLRPSPLVRRAGLSGGGAGRARQGGLGGVVRGVRPGGRRRARRRCAGPAACPRATGAWAPMASPIRGSASWSTAACRSLPRPASPTRIRCPIAWHRPCAASTSDWTGPVRGAPTGGPWAWAGPLQLAAQGAQRRGDAQGWEALRLQPGTWVLSPRRPGPVWRSMTPRAWGWPGCGLIPKLLKGGACINLTAALLRRPMLLIGGWHDPHLRGMLELWRRALPPAGGRPCRWAPGAHLQWHGGVDREQLAFFRRHLIEAPVPQVPWAQEATRRNHGEPQGRRCWGRSPPLHGPRGDLAAGCHHRPLVPHEGEARRPRCPVGG